MRGAERWRPCPVCEMQRRVRADGYMSEHRTYEPFTRRMVRCPGSGLRMIRAGKSLFHDYPEDKIRRELRGPSWAGKGISGDEH